MDPPKTQTEQNLSQTTKPASTNHDRQEASQASNVEAAQQGLTGEPELGAPTAHASVAGSSTLEKAPAALDGAPRRRTTAV